MDQNRTKRLFVLKISIWLGIIADGISVLYMVFPEVSAPLLGMVDFVPTAEFRYAMGLGASLMLGWTILLIWVLQKPMERRGVLIITLVPVILGILISNIYAVVAGIIPIGNMIPLFIQLAIVSTFFCVGLGVTRSLSSME
jgi:hypothetical protein